MKKYIVSILTLFFLIIFSVAGYFVYGKAKENVANSPETLEQKCMSELKYLSNNIVYIMNGINKSHNFDDQKNNVDNEQTDIDWENIEKKVQEIYTTWTTIMIDLNSLEVNKDNLLKYNDFLDELSINCESKNKENVLLNCADLHNLLVTYAEEIMQNDEQATVLKVQNYVLYSYAYVEQENWQESKNNIVKAKESFASILNNQINNIDKIDLINKVYILINELEDDCNNKNKKIFLTGYYNLMQELQNYNL